MREKKHTKIIVIFLFSITIFFLWNHSFFSYLKDFVVLIHELSHAVAALLTGGDVYHIHINENESGETVALPNYNNKWSFLIIVSAGYLGSSLIGSFLLYRGFSDRLTRETLIFFSIVIITLTLKYSSKSSFTATTGLSWGFLLFFFGLCKFSFNRFLLIFLGIAICMYSLYDLLDFTKGIVYTDAGILSRWLLKDSNLKSIQIMGYLIAFLWSFFSLFLIIYSIKISLNLQKESDFSFEIPQQKRRERKVFSS